MSYETIIYNHTEKSPFKVTEADIIIEELEKIKEEISTELKKDGGLWEYGYNNGLKVALTKIENRIEELKGESNAE